MQTLSAHDIMVLLLALGVLLGCARILGEIFQRFKQPAVIGELLAGILLGPTVLEHVLPSVNHFLFPQTGASAYVLSGIATVAVVLFLLVAGMEVDLSSVFRQGKAAMTVSISGIAIPFSIGLLAAWTAPDLFGR